MSRPGRPAATKKNDLAATIAMHTSSHARRTRACAAAALAASLACPPVSQAQTAVTVYGLIDTVARTATNAAAGGAGLRSLTDGAFTGSRLGFRGQEDLGDGWKALFLLEQGIDPSTGTTLQATATADYGQAAAPAGRAFGREAWVGLSAPRLGTLTLGRQYTLAHQMSSRFQPQANPNADALSVLSGHHVARQDNMVKYANQLGPVGVGATVTFSENNGRAWGLSGSYTAGNLDVVAYAQQMRNAADNETRKIHGAGGAYTVSDLTAYLGFMLRSQAVSERRNRVWTGGANYKLGNAWLLTGGYTQDNQNAFGTTAAGTRKVLFVGADHFFSKRTDVYVEVDRNKIDGGYALPVFMGRPGEQTGLSVGLRHRF